MRYFIFKCVLFWIILLCLAIFWGHALRSSKIESSCQQSIERDCDGNQKLITYKSIERVQLEEVNKQDTKD